MLLNGEEVVRMGGTRAEYNVDIWSGNHPFYQGNTGSTVVIDEDQARPAREGGVWRRPCLSFFGLGVVLRARFVTPAQLRPESR